MHHLGAILEEVGLHQQSNRIPLPITLKKDALQGVYDSRDPTLIAPKNAIQTCEDEYGIHQSNEEISQNHKNPLEKQGTTRSIYQALKNGLRRLSSIRRNNSA
jgi:hypothetical protein